MTRPIGIASIGMVIMSTVLAGCSVRIASTTPSTEPPAEERAGSGQPSEEPAPPESSLSEVAQGTSLPRQDPSADRPVQPVTSPPAAQESPVNPTTTAVSLTSVVPPQVDIDSASTSPAVPFQPKEISPDPAVTIDLTFDDVKFDMQKGAPFHRQLLRADIERYHDRTIRIRGYILPGFKERGISEFVLVRDNLECCFGPGAALYDCVLVQMSGRTVEYTVRPVTVQGRFAIEPFEGPDGYPLAIYRMVSDHVD